MGVVKRSVSFDAGLWDDLEREVGSGPVSPLVNEALALYLRRQRGLAAVASYEAEHGAFTDAELTEADDRRMWALHRRMLEQLHTPAVPAGVLAQAWRGALQPVDDERRDPRCRRDGRPSAR